MLHLLPLLSHSSSRCHPRTLPTSSTYIVDTFSTFNAAQAQPKPLQSIVRA